MIETVNLQWCTVRPAFLTFFNMMRNTGIVKLENGNIGICEPYKHFKAVEVGVDEGKNAAFMLEIASNYMHLDLVDCVKKDMVDLNLSPFSGRYTFYQGNSVDVASDMPDGNYHFIYIDADHDDLMSDLEAWYPKLIQGGLIGGHDFWYPPVQRDVFKFFYKKDKIVMYCIGAKQNSKVAGNLDAEIMDWWISPYIEGAGTPEEPVSARLP